MTTRRQFLKTGLAAGAGLFVPWLSRSRLTAAAKQARAGRAMSLEPSALTPYVERLPIPPVIDATTAGSTHYLPIAESAHTFHSMLGPTPTWGYGGASYLGPTFETRRGHDIYIDATNNLGGHLLRVDTALHGPNHAGANDQIAPRVSVHLHGGHTEPQSDGHPEDSFTPGQHHQPAGADAPYHYSNDQDAATLWYHDHALGITRLNVYAGLAGFYLLRDDYELSLGLPIGPPYEIPLAIQDRSFNDDGTLFYPWPWEPEFFGDIAVVNGKVWPYLEVERRLYRFRILNGSSARFYNLRLSSGQPIYQIGTDGGFLPRAVRLTQLLLGPGERADVLIDFSGNLPGERLILSNNAATPFPRGKDLPLPEIMQFRVLNTPAVPGALPQLRRIEPLRERYAVRVRYLSLVELMGPDGPIMSLLNNRRWDTADIEQPQAKTLEIWNIINLTGDTHPIHLHLVQFQLQNRQKFNANGYMRAYSMAAYPPPPVEPYLVGQPRPPDLNEQGWKDTIRANPGEVTRLLVPFGGRSDLPFFNTVPFDTTFVGRYVWHCHILDHEDNEMMLPYEILP